VPEGWNETGPLGDAHAHVGDMAAERTPGGTLSRTQGHAKPVAMKDRSELKYLKICLVYGKAELNLK